MKFAFSVHEMVVGNRVMLQIGESVIPIDRIKHIDLNAGPPCTDDVTYNSIRIVTDDPNEDYVWANDDAVLLRDYLLKCYLKTLKLRDL